METIDEGCPREFPSCFPRSPHPLRVRPRGVKVGFALPRQGARYVDADPHIPICSHRTTSPPHMGDIMMAAGTTSYPDKYSTLACRAGWETRASNHELFGVDLGDHSHLKVIAILEVGM